MLNFSIIGNNIRANRQKLGLTQEALAEILNVTPDYISKIENGIKHPSLSAIEKLADLFNVDVYEIMSKPGTRKFKSGKRRKGGKRANRNLYKIMKKWESETRRFVFKSSETFDEIDKAFQEVREQ